MKSYFILLTCIICFSGLAQNRQERLRKYYDTAFQKQKECLEIQIQFMKIVETNPAVREEYEKSLFYTRRTAQNNLRAGLSLLLSVVGVVVIAAGDEESEVSNVGIGLTAASLVGAEGFLFAGLFSSIKAQQHMRKAFALAGLECPCLPFIKKK